MNDSGVLHAVRALLAIDPDVASGSELGEIARHSSTLRAFADYVDVRVNRRSNQLATDGVDDTGAHALIDDGRLSGREARATGGRDRVCSDLSQFDDALASGACTAGHIDVMATLTRDLNDEERSDLAVIVDDLVADAASQPVGLFERTTKAIIDRIREMNRPNSDADELDRQRKASRVKRWTDRETGMKQTLITLDPLRDTALHAVVEANLAALRQGPANKDRPFDELKVEAFMAAIGSEPAGRRVPEVVVHVDHKSACHGRHADTFCETVDGHALPVSTVQRLCCEAIVSAVVVRSDGTVDQVCAEQRTANRTQRRQLAAMYSTCAHPLCEVGFSNCRMHHIVWWTRGGKTVLANLLPLCEAHHNLVHEGGWNLAMDDDRIVTWSKPDGTRWRADDGPNRRPCSRPDRARSPGPPDHEASSAASATLF
ncbi:MAG: HNH endonuclease signature motif containing protein [Ilumatobacter sp.]